MNIEKFLSEKLGLIKDDNPIGEFLDLSELRFRANILVGFESLLEILEEKDQELQELREMVGRSSRSKLDGTVYGVKR